MPRVKRGTVRRAKRKKLLARTKGFFGNKSKLYRFSKEAGDTALKYAFVGRRNKKRDFRRLWIVRINAAARENGVRRSRVVATLFAGDDSSALERSQEARHPGRRERDVPREIDASAFPAGSLGELMQNRKLRKP